jgi:hypothetical protein
LFKSKLRINLEKISPWIIYRTSRLLTNKSNGLSQPTESKHKLFSSLNQSSLPKYKKKRIERGTLLYIFRSKVKDKENLPFTKNKEKTVKFCVYPVQ